MRTREWVSLAFGAAACAWAVLAIGSAFRWAQAVTALLLAGALVLQIKSKRRLTRISPVIALPGIALALTAISLIPLPTGLVELLDPTGTGLRQDGAELLQISGWTTLTRDPAGSLRALTYFTILLGVAVLALRMTASERGRYRVLALVGGICVLVGLVVAVHALLGMESLYGVYRPEQAQPSVLGPLLNENHLGGLVALGTCVAIGLAMYPQQRTSLRVGWVAAAAVCGATTAASGSRGALVALVAGTIVAGGVLLAQRMKQRFGDRASFATSTVPITIVGICVVLVVVYSSAGKVTEELSHTSMHELHQERSKFAAWQSAKELISESPWVGVGRGGFESSFTRVHVPSGTVIFSHVENEYIQVVLDWGVIGAAVLAGALAWFGLLVIRRWRDGPLAAGALGALVAIAVQSTVDFGVELLGLAVPVVAVAATVAYVPLRQATTKDLRVVLLRAGHVLGLVTSGVLLFTSPTTTLAEDHKALARPGVTLEDVREVVERHPLDYFSFAVASSLGKGSDPASIRLLNHALRLHPTHPDLHRMAARALLRSGHEEQAIVEYALALRSSPDPRALLTEIVSRFSVDLAARAIPIDYRDVSIPLGILRDLKKEDVAARWLARVIQQRPQDIMLCNTVFEFSLSHGDVLSAEAAGRHCVELLPDYDARLSLAKLLSSKGSHREVIRLLQDVPSWRGRIDEKATAWLMLCDAHVAIGDPTEAKQCLRRLDGARLLGPERRRELTERQEKLR